MYSSLKEPETTSAYWGDIMWDDERHLLKIACITISFTTTEYLILSSLRQDRPISYTILARSLYNRALDRKARIMMNKHIERIRGKLRGTGIYIYCVLGYGYFLLPEI